MHRAIASSPELARIVLKLRNDAAADVDGLGWLLEDLDAVFRHVAPRRLHAFATTPRRLS